MDYIIVHKLLLYPVVFSSTIATSEKFSFEGISEMQCKASFYCKNVSVLVLIKFSPS